VATPIPTPEPTPVPTPTPLPPVTAVQGLPEGWGQEVIYDHPITYPSKLALDGEGNVLVVSRGNGKILKMGPGGELSTFADVSGLAEVFTLAYQPGSDRLIMTTMMTGLYALSDGELSTLQMWGVMANALAVDTEDDSFYGCSGAPGGSLVHFDADGDPIATIVEGTEGCSQLVLDAANDMLYYSETFPGRITAVDLSDGTREVLVEGVGIPGTYEPIGLSLDGDGVLHSFPNAHGLFRYEEGSFEKVMDSIAGAGALLWSPVHDAFLMANGVGANVIAYDPSALTAEHLTPYLNAIAVVETVDCKVLACDGHYFEGRVVSVDASGFVPFTDDLRTNCQHLERDGHGTVYAGMTDGSIWTIEDDGTASLWLDHVSDRPIVSLQFDALNDAFVAITGDDERSSAEVWRIPIDDPDEREKVLELDDVRVTSSLPAGTVDVSGNIYVLERQANVIHRIANGDTTATVFATSVLENEAITVPKIEYLSNEDALLVSTIVTYDLWPLDGSGRSIFAHNSGAVDNFAISENPDGNVVAIHSGQVFRLVHDR